MDVLPAYLNRDSFQGSFKGLVALEIINDLPIGFPINNIISQEKGGKKEKNERKGGKKKNEKIKKKEGGGWV